MIHRDNKYQRNASMNGTRKNWKNKQRSMTPWNMDVHMIDCSINLATKEKKKKKRSSKCEKQNRYRFLCSWSGGFLYIRFEKAEARKEIGARIKKKRRRRRHVDRADRAEHRLKFAWNESSRLEDSRDFTPRPWSAISRQLHRPGNETSKARAHRTNFLHNGDRGGRSSSIASALSSALKRGKRTKQWDKGAGSDRI